MLICLNGNNKEVNESLTVAELLQQEQLMLEYCAIAINREFIPKSTYRDRVLQPGDQVECLTPMQGG